MTARGKTVLVGLTHVDEEGEVIRREQFHGTITAGDENDFVGAWTIHPPDPGE